MSQPEPSPGNGTPGVVQQVQAFLAACAQYASARIRLATAEGREAAAHGFKLLLIAGAAIILAAFGWLFLCLAAVFLVSKAFGGPHAWLWAAMLMAGAHFAGVILLVLGLKSRVATPLFPLTTDELKKDQEWLDQQNRTKPRS